MADTAVPVKLGRILPRTYAIRPRHTIHADLPEGNLQSRAVSVRVPSFDAASELVNEHEFGNGTAILTQDSDVARNLSGGVKAGKVGINVPIPVPMAFHSFGGWKRSLFSDHYVHGLEGVRFYTRLKNIFADGPQASGRVRTFNCRCVCSWYPPPDKPWHLSPDGSNPALAGGPHMRA